MKRNWSEILRKREEEKKKRRLRAKLQYSKLSEMAKIQKITSIMEKRKERQARESIEEREMRKRNAAMREKLRRDAVNQMNERIHDTDNGNGEIQHGERNVYDGKIVNELPRIRGVRRFEFEWQTTIVAEYEASAEAIRVWDAARTSEMQ